MSTRQKPNLALISSEFSASIPTSTGKEKRIKMQDDKASHVITGYQAPFRCNFIHDILIYDIPVKWNNYILLSHLST
ncbi:hypothetical protein RCL_jg17191.t1 [Rhizophagus clarus]|uniref:Uncharacterized protein n=1 Tax=Rhizophagus clarus TaxID=94130 RepID=A0A8H3LIN5_9GLOM|nr:hypothetical protein RCL_jg17191.t1 [Rhizophagus clarus]